MSDQSGNLNLFTVFHLNLAYSAIEEEERAEVLENCYWPLLELASDHNLPLGIEASGYTLEEAARLDPEWTEALRSLVHGGPCEFVGSGYAQLIGPLVPAAVNEKNLEFGLGVYDRLLDTRPRVALVNEQAYSGGLLELYRDAGYDAIFTEWDNPASRHEEWDETWQYYPQVATGPGETSLPVLWNNSIAFQKFQRYVHGELTLHEYMGFLGGHVGGDPRLLCLYGNDVEVFDFRPGRYHTEADLGGLGEWDRIFDLFEAIVADSRFDVCSPSEALSFNEGPGGGNDVRLESSPDPVVVKKQRKYNLTRWAVTGRNDLDVNTRCWQLYEHLRARDDPVGDDSGEADWRELCYLWSSDFRTHITDSRWSRYLERLGRAETEVVRTPSLRFGPPGPPDENGAPRGVERDGDILSVRTDPVSLRLNCRRGLAIDGVWFGDETGPPRCGTLPHGFFDDIGLGADWYTGHTVYETPGEPKVTDLNRTEPTAWVAENGDVLVRGEVPSRNGPIVKTIRVETEEPGVSLSYRLNWDELPMGSLRLGHVTLHPDAFDRSSLFYRTHNGGRVPGTFPLESEVDHGDPVSFLVSARAGVGLTEGEFVFGDGTRALRVDVDKTLSALVGMVTFRPLNDSYFCRLSLSALEMDETSRDRTSEDAEIRARVRLSPADAD